EHRNGEIAPRLLTQLAAARTADEAAAIATRAQNRSLTEVYRQALEKQIALTADEVDKMQLQYTLARALEQHQDVPAAVRIVGAVYAAHPRVLGVVRNTVDFDWRNGRREQALAVLQ